MILLYITMKKVLVDTDEIGKKIGLALYREFSKKNLTQTELAKKIWIRQSAVSWYFNWKVTTKNLDQYWKIAEAIPISQIEFDEIVEKAKAEVLWFPEQNSETKNPDEQIQIALNSKGFSEKEILEMMDFIKFKESQK